MIQTVTNPLPKPSQKKPQPLQKPSKSTKQEEFFSEQLEKLKKLEETIEKSLKNSINTLLEYQTNITNIQKKYKDYQKNYTDYQNSKNPKDQTQKSTEFKQTIKKMELQIEEIKIVNKKYKNEIENIKIYTKGLKSRITGSLEGEGFADPDDNKYNIYIKITKHGLKLSQAPSGEGFENMINKIVYETSANFLIGPKKIEMFYKDYSDGVNILFIELKFGDKVVFGVFNFLPEHVNEDFVKEIIEKSGLDLEETIEEFYEEFLCKIFKGLDYYANTSLKRLNYYLHYVEEGTFKNLIEFN